MKMLEAALERGNSIPGTVPILCWSIGLGIIGILLVVAVLYAMVAESHIPAVICSAVLLSPFVLIWIIRPSHTRQEEQSS